MSPENFLLSPVDLKIIQDWNPILEICKEWIEQATQHPTATEPYGTATLYHLGKLICVGQHRASENWFTVNGPWPKKYLTWLDQMLTDMVELEPVYNVSILVGNAAEHTDWPSAPTAFNYPITKTDAKTYVKYQDTEHTYLSLPDQPWILNTQYPHGVKNTEFRPVFNLHFGKEFAVVKKWFDDHPGLVYQ
jgi:hypothetical protein